LVAGSAPSTTKLLALLKLPMKVTLSTVTLFSCIKTYARPSPNCTDSVAGAVVPTPSSNKISPGRKPAIGALTINALASMTSPNVLFPSVINSMVWLLLTPTLVLNTSDDAP
jgi:hypothetical protein